MVKFLKKKVEIPHVGNSHLQYKSCIKACFHIDRGIKHLLHDVRMGFEGGKCALVDHVCKDMTAVAIRKKSPTFISFCSPMGVQFYHVTEFLSLTAVKKAK